MSQQIQLARTQRIAVISIFSALAIATDYAMLPLANIKLMDSIVFVSALAFGVGVGASVGALTWLVYGSLNPYGSAGGLLMIILVVSESIYAFLGYMAQRKINLDEVDFPTRSVFWGSLGLVGAFIYDLNTIVTPALIVGVPPLPALATLLPAIPFMLAHEISDFAFFATAAPALYSAVHRVTRIRGRQPV